MLPDVPTPRARGWLDRRDSALVRDERTRALQRAARLDGIALAGQVALHRAAELSDLETRLARLAPSGDARYQAIADTTAAAMLSVIQRAATEL